MILKYKLTIGILQLEYTHLIIMLRIRFGQHKGASMHGALKRNVINGTLVDKSRKRTLPGQRRHY